MADTVNAEELFNKALDLQRNHKLLEAAAIFMNGHAIDASDWRFPWEAGIIYTYYLQNPEKGIECFEKVIPLLKKSVAKADGYYHLGFSFVIAKNDEAAHKNFTLCFKACPVHLLCGLELSKLFIRRARFDEAQQLLKQTIETNSVLQVTPSMLPEGLQGGPHVDLIAIMELARLNFIYLKDARQGLFWAEKLSKKNDTQRLKKLSSELAALKMNGESEAVSKLFQK